MASIAVGHLNATHLSKRVTVTDADGQTVTGKIASITHSATGAVSSIFPTEIVITVLGTNVKLPPERVKTVNIGD